MSETYFIITPGVDLGSCVLYQGNVMGNYIKFGDQKSSMGDRHAGLRAQYVTHNPDIGIGAIMDSSAFSNPNLGTLLKSYIKDEIGIDPVGNTEWFSIRADASWKLFKALQSWDGKKPGYNHLDTLKNIIRMHLG